LPENSKKAGSTAACLLKQQKNKFKITPDLWAITQAGKIKNYISTNSANRLAGRRVSKRREASQKVPSFYLFPKSEKKGISIWSV